MKAIRILALLGLFAALFAAPSQALAAPIVSPLHDDVVVFGEDYLLAADMVVDGSVLLFGGDATIQTGATVSGDVVLFGGDIDLAGTVNGTIIALGGDVNLASTAVVTGDVVSPGGNLERADGALISGNVFNESQPLSVALPDGADIPEINITPEVIRDIRHFERGGNFGAVGRLVWLLFQAFAMSTVALLVMLFAPIQLRRVADTAVSEPVSSGGFGLLGTVLLPILLLVSVVTLVLPPVILLVALIAFAFGWIALGLEVGRRLAIGFNVEWSPVVQAWLGTMALSIVVGIVAWVPCVGWVAGFVVGCLGFGAVLLTRFGTQSYPEQAAPLKALPAPRKRATRK
jgi:hypothetical protein